MGPAGYTVYMAPELWCVVEVEYVSSVVTWAVGVVTYMLLSGRRPFDHPNKREKKRIICEDPLQFPSPHWDKISNDAKDFCSKLMMKRPAERMNAASAVKHPWIKKHSLMRASSGGISASEEIAKHGEIDAALEAFAEADGITKLAMQVIAFTTPPAKLEELRQLFRRWTRTTRARSASPNSPSPLSTIQRSRASASRRCSTRWILTALVR